MKLDITVPSVGESVTQGILATWLKAEGETVTEGSDLYELETDKATVTVPAPASGVLSISVKAGTEVTIGQVVGGIDPSEVAARTPQPRQEREGVAAEREAADGNPPEADGEGAVR